MPTIEDLGDTMEVSGSPEKVETSPKNPPRMLATEEEDDEDIDETLAERLWGLTEMFPDSLRNATYNLTNFSWQATKWIYGASRLTLWVVASSATLLALPIMFETERAQMEEQQLKQQRQILLGPNAAVSGEHPPPMALGAMPPLPPGPGMAQSR